MAHSLDVRPPMVRLDRRSAHPRTHLQRNHDVRGARADFLYRKSGSSAPVGEAAAEDVADGDADERQRGAADGPEGDLADVELTGGRGSAPGEDRRWSRRGSRR